MSQSERSDKVTIQTNSDWLPVGDKTAKQTYLTLKQSQKRLFLHPSPQHHTPQPTARDRLIVSSNVIITATTGDKINGQFSADVNHSPVYLLPHGEPDCLIVISEGRTPPPYWPSARRISPAAKARNANQWAKHPRQRSSPCLVFNQWGVRVLSLSAWPHSLGGHMADHNYTLCTSLSGEYLSASVCSVKLSAWLYVECRCDGMHRPLVTAQPDGDYQSYAITRNPLD